MPKVQIPAVEQFHIISGDHEGRIDAGGHGEILLDHLYRLMEANEGVEVPLCTANKQSRQCIKDGVRVFVWGGFIPGIGTRPYYVFSEISLAQHQLEFYKDNAKTKFIGTPMLARGNKCRVNVKEGGLQVQMDKYYANWAGIGNMVMAEGWAIDFIDFDQGIVGLHFELDIKGPLVAGGGSRYILLKFPQVPESNAQPAAQVQNENVPPPLKYLIQKPMVNQESDTEK